MTDRENITGKYILIGQTPVPEPDLLKWALWFEEDPDKRIVQQTKIGCTMVSTVFLGLDHGLLFDGPPLLFETMVFVGKDGRGIYQERCSTWLEAEAQHAQAVALYKRWHMRVWNWLRRFNPWKR